MNRLKLFILCLSLVCWTRSLAIDIPTSSKAERSIASVEVALKKQLAEKRLNYGAPIFIRIFKDPGVLEVWIESDDGLFKMFKTYDICSFSGGLGPKLKEGDNQSPEGFYFVNAGRLNPWSRFHLSFNLGYPNKYDAAHGRTGSALMVHGRCVSIGCYAMTDRYINEIYALAVAAFESGQPIFRVHAFPFRLESGILARHADNRWYDFWLNLKEGYDYFNVNKRPPDVNVINKKYVFNP